MKTLEIPFDDIAPIMELLYIAVPMNEAQHKALDAFWKKYPELEPHTFDPSIRISITPKP